LGLEQVFKREAAKYQNQSALFYQKLAIASVFPLLSHDTGGTQRIGTNLCRESRVDFWQTILAAPTRHTKLETSFLEIGSEKYGVNDGRLNHNKSKKKKKTCRSGASIFWNWSSFGNLTDSRLCGSLNKGSYARAIKKNTSANFHDCSSLKITRGKKKLFRLNVFVSSR